MQHFTKSTGRSLRAANRTRSLVFFASLILFHAPGGGLLAQDPGVLPAAPEVVAKLAERARAAREKTSLYTYTKVRVSEELNDRDAVESKRVLLYQVAPGQGFEFEKLVRKDGKPLTKAEEVKQAEREKKFRRRAATRSIDAPEEERSIRLDDRVLSRFDFKVVGRESVAGRPALVLAFSPKNDLPAKQVADRLLNKIPGKLWVDEADHEMARLDVVLTGKVTLGWGILGAMQKFNWFVERFRAEDGAWLPKQASGQIWFRSLFSAKRVKWSEKASDYSKGPAL